MTDPIQPWPTVRRGDDGHPVRTLQWLLRARERPVAVDGIFGPETEGAVRSIQKALFFDDPAAGAGIVGGVVDAATWPALIITVRQGDRGDAVRGVQQEFADRDLSGIPGHGLRIDGIFGPITDAAVRGFQKALAADAPSVAIDGIVGPVTWRALVSGMLFL